MNPYALLSYGLLFAQFVLPYLPCAFLFYALGYVHASHFEYRRGVKDAARQRDSVSLPD